MRPSVTGGDGLGLCQGPCQPGGPPWWGKEGKPRACPILGSATCWQGIIPIGVFHQELRSHGWPGRGVANAFTDVRATWLKRTTGYYYRRNRQFPCRQMTFPVCQDIKISKVWNQWLIGMKSFIIFDFSGTRARTADFTGAVNPHTWAAIELLQVLAIAPFPGSGGAMISPPHLLSFVEMRKPDCFVLRVPFEIRHTRPCLS